MDANNLDYVKVAHQGNYSFDPMENNFPTGSSVRFQHYSGTGVPHSALNGTSGYPSTIVTASTMAAVAAQTTPYQVAVTQNWISATSVDVTVVVSNTTPAAVSTANKIFISMVEETVSFPSAPGSNGESVFHWVLREMYDATSGAGNATAGSALGTIAANSNQTFTFNVTPPSYIADLNQVSFAAYIQSATSDDMEQAGKSIRGGVPGLLDLATATSSTVGAGYCNYSFDPVISFTNNSPGIPVTNVIVEYDINGGTPVQETYNGNLTQGQSTAIAFPNTNLAPGSSTINYNVVSVNGANAYSGGSVAMAPETFSKINTTASSTPISEGFQGADNQPAPAGAIADNPNGITAQTVSSSSTPATSNLGGHGNSDGSFLWYFYGISAGQSSKLIFEKRDFSGTSGNQLTFSHAYAQYQAQNDALKISISTDCGGTWTQVWSKSGATLATVPAQTTAFWPNASQWVDNTVDLSAYDNAPDVMIAFEGISAYGNSLFIDDVNTSIASSAATNNIFSKLSIYPNPAKDILIIEGTYTSATIYDVFGKLVLTTNAQKTIDVSALSNGVYFVNIISENKLTVKKITVAK
ncbi:MAG: T9SS type A sorting domain-containing protein [Flavobacteriales bacterium]|nr:T9SS type A sorting domain-containing protein [Flavobacteriales bacterium]